MPTHADIPRATPAPPPSAALPPTGSGGNATLIAAIAYLGGPVTGVAILILEKNNSYIRFHAMQSTLFFGGLILVNLALGYLPFLGFWSQQFLTMVAFIIWIVLLYKAFAGEEYELPYIGPIARKQLARMG